LQKKGGMLADDMGLGKTAQVSVYLKGLFESMKIKKVIVIVPATLKKYWRDEISFWCPKIPVRIFDNKDTDKKKVMKKLKDKGGILICSYGNVTSV
jgi:SNF2 family DNA or RNA helicase